MASIAVAGKAGRCVSVRNVRLLFVLEIARDILKLHYPKNVMLFCSHAT
jgi:hypothetical protein